MSKQEALKSPHYVVLIEDGQCLQTCKRIKLDLNFFKSKYFIEPPKYISKMPKDYLKIQNKFN